MNSTGLDYEDLKITEEDFTWARITGKQLRSNFEKMEGYVRPEREEKLRKMNYELARDMYLSMAFSRTNGCAIGESSQQKKQKRLGKVVLEELRHSGIAVKDSNDNTILEPYEEEKMAIPHPEPKYSRASVDLDLDVEACIEAMKKIDEMYGEPQEKFQVTPDEGSMKEFFDSDRNGDRIRPVRIRFSDSYTEDGDTQSKKISLEDIDN